MAVPPALPATLIHFTHPSAGRIGLYDSGAVASGGAFSAGAAAITSATPAASPAPLLLVHSVNAAASAGEVRPLFEHHRQQRRVFAIDLPGYGSSDRSDRDYTPRLMVDALHGAVAQIQARCGPGPVDALAVSLGCEFLARAAVEAPGAFRSLALVSPTGLRGGQAGHGPAGSTRAVPGLRAALRGPGGRWGGPLFRQLTRPGVVRFFLRKTWGSREIDETMWADAVHTAQAPGAEHAPLCFLSGGLFSADILAVYEALALPVWLSHGVRGDFTDYRGKALLAQRPHWRFTVFQTGALPYFEVAAAFNAAHDAFLAAPEAPLPPDDPAAARQ